MPRLTEMRKKVKIETLTSLALSYIDKRVVATARELGTVLPRMIGGREISEKILDAVIVNLKGKNTPSGKIVVVVERGDAQPPIEQKHRKSSPFVVAVGPQDLCDASGKYAWTSITYTGTICAGTVKP
jgi:hypothetical protein